MQKKYSPFSTPFHDPYRIGFSLYSSDKPNWRQRTIAAVAWNGIEKEAYFFNPDGLALPLEPHPWELPPLLERHAVKREFSLVEGLGVFAIKQYQVKAFTPALLAQWVTYRLVGPDARYAEDAGVWAEHLERDVLRACDDVKQVMEGQLDRFWPEALRRSSVPGALHDPDGWADFQRQRAAHIERCQQETDQERRQHFAAQYAQQCAYDKQINAWLRGEAGGPPLLALMKGAA